MNPATNLAPKLAQLYPGVYNPDGQLDGDADAAHKLPTKPLKSLWTNCCPAKRCQTAS